MAYLLLWNEFDSGSSRDLTSGETNMTWRDAKTHAARFVRCQSIRQRPPDIGTQTSFFRGVPLA